MNIANPLKKSLLPNTGPDLQTQKRSIQDCRLCSTSALIDFIHMLMTLTMWIKVYFIRKKNRHLVYRLCLIGTVLRVIVWESYYWIPVIRNGCWTTIKTLIKLTWRTSNNYLAASCPLCTKLQTHPRRDFSQIHEPWSEHEAPNS